MLINFDYDGVLVDSLDRQTLIAQTIQRDMHLPVTVTLNLLQTVENLNAHGVGRASGVPEDSLDDFEQRIFAAQKNSSELPTLFPGIDEMIRKLSREHTLTVISASNSKEIQRVLDLAKIAENISTLVGGDTKGTKADKIEKIRNQFSFSQASTVMVGDSRSDIRAGKKAGVTTIAVTWGYQSEELLRAEEPDYLVKTPDNLYAQLVALNQLS